MKHEDESSLARCQTNSFIGNFFFSFLSLRVHLSKPTQKAPTKNIQGWGGEVGEKLGMKVVWPLASSCIWWDIFLSHLTFVPAVVETLPAVHLILV